MQDRLFESDFEKPPIKKLCNRFGVGDLVLGLAYTLPGKFPVKSTRYFLCVFAVYYRTKEAEREVPLQKKKERHIGQHYFGPGRLYIEGALGKRSDVREIIVHEAERLLGSVDLDEIAEDVFFALESIDVHELWDRSGSHSDGYTSPEDMAMEMVEEELDSFSDQIVRYHNLGLHDEEKLYCMGVLKGLYRFEKEAKSEFEIGHLT